MLVLVACLIAFFLRVNLIQKQSLWGDEGASLSYALSGSLDVLLERVLATDPHPPLYYGLLHLWLGVSGDSDLAIRWTSVFFGVLIVPLAYKLAQQVSERALLSVLVALLAAVSPFLVYYSQEARMYSMAAFLSTLALYGLLRAISGGGRWWLVHTLAGLAALYTLGVTVAVIPATLALIAWGLVRRWWGAPLKVALPALVSCSLLVASVVFWNSLQIGQFGQFLSLTDIDLAPLLALDTLKEALLVSAFGVTLDPLYSAARTYQTIDNWEQVFQPGYTVIMAVSLMAIVFGGLRSGLRDRAPIAILLAAFFVLAVWAGAYFLRMATTRYASRLLLIGAPFVLLVVALGLDALPRRSLKAVAVVLVLIAMGYSLWQNYENPVFARSDYRGLAAYLDREMETEDAVYLHGPPLRLLDRHYRPAAGSVYSLPKSAPVGSNWPEVEKQLETLAGRHSRLWLAVGAETDYDPERRVERWLDEHGYQIEGHWFGNNRLALYVFPASMASARMSGQLVSRSGLALVSVETSRAAENTPGASVPLAFTWRLSSRPERAPRLSLRLTDAAGYTWAQRDQDLGGHLNPPYDWPLNEPVITRTGLRLPAGLPPAEYLLEAVVYESGGQTLFGGKVWSNPVRVVRGGPVNALRLAPPVKADIPLGPLRIIGYYLPDKLVPGEEFPLRLYWMVEGYPAEDDSLVVRLGDGPDQVLPFKEGNLYLDRRHGEGLVSQNIMKVPASAAGRQPVMVRLGGDSGGAMVRLAELEVGTVSRSFVEPAAQETLKVALGGAVELIGLDITAPGNQQLFRVRHGQPLDVVLYWKGLVEMDTSYTVFVQLLDNQGRLVSQRDAVPAGGRRPTTGWLPGEVVSDAHRLEIPAGLGPGTYSLISGMYDAKNGVRLKVGQSDYVKLAEMVADE